jgi:hypothetical protein
LAVLAADGANIKPKGMAIDTRNNNWVAAGAADAIYAFDQNGNPFGPSAAAAQGALRSRGGCQR